MFVTRETVVETRPRVSENRYSVVETKLEAEIDNAKTILVSGVDKNCLGIIEN